MYRRLAGWIPFLLLSLIVCGAHGTPPGSILALYHRSDALFHLSNATVATDSARPRIRVGNSSEITTHTPGPMPKEKNPT